MLQQAFLQEQITSSACLPGVADGDIRSAPVRWSNLQEVAHCSAAAVSSADTTSSFLPALQAGLPQSAVVAAHGNFDSKSGASCTAAANTRQDVCGCRLFSTLAFFWQACLQHSVLPCTLQQNGCLSSPWYPPMLTGVERTLQQQALFKLRGGQGFLEISTIRRASIQLGKQPIMWSYMACSCAVLWCQACCGAFRYCMAL